jgi:hypothetical protein
MGGLIPKTLHLTPDVNGLPRADCQRVGPWPTSGDEAPEPFLPRKQTANLFRPSVTRRTRSLDPTAHRR